MTGDGADSISMVSSREGNGKSTQQIARRTNYKNQFYSDDAPPKARARIFKRWYFIPFCRQEPAQQLEATLTQESRIDVINNSLMEQSTNHYKLTIKQCCHPEQFFFLVSQWVTITSNYKRYSNPGTTVRTPATQSQSLIWHDNYQYVPFNIFGDA